MDPEARSAWCVGSGSDWRTDGPFAPTGPRQGGTWHDRSGFRHRRGARTARVDPLSRAAASLAQRPGHDAAATGRGAARRGTGHRRHLDRRRRQQPLRRAQQLGHRGRAGQRRQRRLPRDPPRRRDGGVRRGRPTGRHGPGAGVRQHAERQAGQEPDDPGRRTDLRHDHERRRCARGRGARRRVPRQQGADHRQRRGADPRGVVHVFLHRPEHQLVHLHAVLRRRHGRQRCSYAHRPLVDHAPQRGVQ